MPKTVFISRFPSQECINQFVFRNPRRVRRLKYLKKQSNRWSVWAIRQNHITAFLAGIKTGKSVEVWYWEDNSNPPERERQFQLLVARVLECFADNKSVLWYPKTTRLQQQLFNRAGFRPIRELYMTRRLLRNHPPKILLPAEYNICPWSNSYIKEAARLDYVGQKNTVNALVTTVLQTRAGCEKVLRQNVCMPHFAGGITLWHSSKLVGYALGFSENKALLVVSSLIVHPKHRGKRLGEALLSSFLADCGKKLKSAGLAVYDANVAAVKLYRRMGFKTQKSNNTFLLLSKSLQSWAQPDERYRKSS